MDSPISLSVLKVEQFVKDYTCINDNEHILLLYKELKLVFVYCDCSKTFDLFLFL